MCHLCFGKTDAAVYVKGLLHLSLVRPHASACMLGRSHGPTFPMGLAWCNGLPTACYSYKASANHTIDPVIPPISNSLPRWAVSMNKVQVSSSSLVRRGTWCLWGGDWDLGAFSTSQPGSLFSIQPPQPPHEGLKRWEQTQIVNDWSTSFPLTAYLWNCCVVLCSGFFFLLCASKDCHISAEDWDAREEKPKNGNSYGISIGRVMASFSRWQWRLWSVACHFQSQSCRTKQTHILLYQQRYCDYTTSPSC